MADRDGRVLAPAAARRPVCRPGRSGRPRPPRRPRAERRGGGAVRSRRPECTAAVPEAPSPAGRPTRASDRRRPCSDRSASSDTSRRCGPGSAAAAGFRRPACPHRAPPAVARPRPTSSPQAIDARTLRSPPPRTPSACRRRRPRTPDRRRRALSPVPDVDHRPHSMQRSPRAPQRVLPGRLPCHRSASLSSAVVYEFIQMLARAHRVTVERVPLRCTLTPQQVLRALSDRAAAVRAQRQLGRRRRDRRLVPAARRRSRRGSVRAARQPAGARTPRQTSDRLPAQSVAAGSAGSATASAHGSSDCRRDRRVPIRCRTFTSPTTTTCCDTTTRASGGSRRSSAMTAVRR